MAKSITGLYRAAGGFAARRRAAFENGCQLCGRESVGVIETLKGTFGICEGHAKQAREYGYTVISPTALSGERDRG